MKSRYFANKLIGKNKKEGVYIAIYNLYAGNIYPWNNIFYFSRRRLALFIIFACLKSIRAYEIVNKWKKYLYFPLLICQAYANVVFSWGRKNNAGALPDIKNAPLYLV